MNRKLVIAAVLDVLFFVALLVYHTLWPYPCECGGLAAWYPTILLTAAFFMAVAYCLWGLRKPLAARWLAVFSCAFFGQWPVRYFVDQTFLFPFEIDYFLFLLLEPYESGMLIAVWFLFGCVFLGVVWLVDRILPGRWRQMVERLARNGAINRKLVIGVVLPLLYRLLWDLEHSVIASVRPDHVKLYHVVFLVQTGYFLVLAVWLWGLRVSGVVRGVGVFVWALCAAVPTAYLTVVEEPPYAEWFVEGGFLPRFLESLVFTFLGWLGVAWLFLAAVWLVDRLVPRRWKREEGVPAHGSG